MLRRSVFVGLLLASVLGGSCTADRWNGWVEGQLDGGNRKVIGRPAALMPLCERGNSLVFGYVRGVFDDEQEVDVGLGWRALRRCSVFGAYVFYDFRRRSCNHFYHQVTIGADYYTQCLEAHVNGYIPVSGSRDLPDTSEAMGVIVNNQIRVVGHLDDREATLYGLDFLVGSRCNIACCGNVEMRFLAGGYWFHRKHGYRRYGGPRARLEFTTYNLRHLGQGARLTWGVEVQWDHIYAGEGFAFLRLRLPFAKQCGSCNPCLCCLEQRMTHRIERLDILPSRRLGDLCDEPATFRGEEISNIVTVNAATADVPGTVTAAGPNSLVLFDGSLGIIDVTGDPPITMQEDQTLAGGGTILTVTAPTCGDAELVIPGTPPVVTGSANPLVQLSNRGTIDGITFSSVNTAILGSNISSPWVVNSNIGTTAANAFGISLNTVTGALVQNTTVRTSGSTAHGINATSLSGGLFRNVTVQIEGADSLGISLTNSTDVEIIDSDVTLTDAGDHAIFVNSTSDLLIQRTSVTNASGAGAGIFLLNAPNVSILNDTINTSGNDSEGISNNFSTNLLVQDTVIDTAGLEADGILTAGTNTAIVNTTIRTTGDQARGITIEPSTNISVSGADITTSGPGSQGIRVNIATDLVIATSTIRTTGATSNGIEVNGATGYQITSNDVSVGDASSVVLVLQDADTGAIGTGVNNNNFEGVTGVTVATLNDSDLSGAGNTAVNFTTLCTGNGDNGQIEINGTLCP